MKKVSIFEINTDDTLTLLRIVSVSPSFQGIGVHGNVIFSEFKKLADDLEPGAGRKKIEIMDL